MTEQNISKEAKRNGLLLDVYATDEALSRVRSSDLLTRFALAASGTKPVVGTVVGFSAKGERFTATVRERVIPAATAEELARDWAAPRRERRIAEVLITLAG